MPNYTLTPLMQLPNPTPGVDPGPDYANNLQASLNIIDQHNHSPGSGNIINPNGININTDLAFNSNNATLLRSTRFVPQASPLALSTDLGCLYVSGVDLYYNPANSTTGIQITSGGSVNATSSGIASGTATASFSGGVLVVDSNTATPANIQGGSLLLGNNVANSKYLTLSPPSSMAANYSLVLPSIPASTQFLTLDTSGNIATATGVQANQIATGAIAANQIAPNSLSDSQVAVGGIGTASLANNSVTPAKLSALNTSGVVWSTSSTTSSTFANVSGGSTTITVSGLRPVLISLDVTSANSALTVVSASSGGQVIGNLRITTSNTVFFLTYELEGLAGSTVGTTSGYPIANTLIDIPPAGSYTVTLAINVTAPGGGTSTLSLPSGILRVTEL
jgi:hypothetical protein